MYFKEARFVVRALDMAIDSLSRAEYSIRKSEAHTVADIETSETLHGEAEKLREVKKHLKSVYAGMNE